MKKISVALLAITMMSCNKPPRKYIVMIGITNPQSVYHIDNTVRIDTISAATDSAAYFQGMTKFYAIMITNDKLGIENEWPEKIKIIDDKGNYLDQILPKDKIKKWNKFMTDIPNLKNIMSKHNTPEP